VHVGVPDKRDRLWLAKPLNVVINGFEYCVYGALTPVAQLTHAVGHIGGYGAFAVLPMLPRAMRGAADHRCGFLLREKKQAP